MLDVFLRMKHKYGKNGFGDICFLPVAQVSVVAHGTLETDIRCALA